MKKKNNTLSYIYASNIYQLLHNANELGIGKDDIVTVFPNGDLYTLIYYC